MRATMVDPFSESQLALLDAVFNEELANGEPLELKEIVLAWQEGRLARWKEKTPDHHSG